MSAAWNRRRPTRASLPAREQECRLIDSAADQYCLALRARLGRSWHIDTAKEFLRLARLARAQVGPVLP